MALKPMRTVDLAPETPDLPTEERMFQAWCVLSAAERAGLPVARLDRLYDGYLDALKAHIAAIVQRSKWATLRGAGERDGG